MIALPGDELHLEVVFLQSSTFPAKFWTLQSVICSLVCTIFSSPYYIQVSISCLTLLLFLNVSMYCNLRAIICILASSYRLKNVTVWNLAHLIVIPQQTPQSQMHNNSTWLWVLHITVYMEFVDLWVEELFLHPTSNQTKMTEMCECDELLQDGIVVVFLFNISYWP